MQQEKTKQKGLMTEGVIWKELLLFSVPLLLGNLFQQDVYKRQALPHVQSGE